MKAITVCVDYDDYLAISLPHNKKLFEEICVITTDKDTATQKLAQDLGAEVVISDRFYEDGSVFNKGKAINDALNQMSGWVCHWDADVMLPDFRKLPELDRDVIYGCPRLMCPDLNAWHKYLTSGSVKKWRKFKPCNFRIGTDIYNQYLPLGYTQIFNLDSLDKPYYPEQCPTAAESDVLFSLKWKQHKCLDDFSVIHLPVIGPGGEGVNWEGRKSPRFQ